MPQSEKLIATLDQFNTAVYLKNPQGQYLSMNRKGIQVMGQSDAHILSRTAFDLFDLPTASEMMESDQYTLNSHSIYTRAFNATDRQTGKPLHFFTAKAPIISPSGQALGIVGMSIVNSKNLELFAESCKLLPRFIKYKYSHLIEELIETRTVAEFFKIH
jgi:PAS domain-containing protein